MLVLETVPISSCTCIIGAQLPSIFGCATTDSTDSGFEHVAEV